MKHQKLQIKYLLNTFFHGNNKFKNFKGLIHNYYRNYTNNYLQDYIYKIDNTAKVEVNFRRQIEYIKNLIST